MIWRHDQEFEREKMAALSQLAAGVAHELGNPLSIISSSLQYLDHRFAQTSDPAREFTTTALANVERMQALLRTMFEFAGVKKSHFEYGDVREAISEVLRFTSAECVRRGINVKVSFDPFFAKAWMDSGGIKQILLNLIKNALEALAGGGDTLTVCTRLAQGDDMGIIEIGNNGPPISPDVAEHLFRPFHTTKDGGTGLGLHLSRQIAREHGGELEAESLPAGARFTLRLPADRRRGGDDGCAHSDRRR